MENARECYHCAASHPELGVTFPIGITPEFSAEDAADMHAYRTRMASHGLMSVLSTALGGGLHAFP